MKYFNHVLTYGKEQGVDFPTILQSYNMGLGYINFISKNGGHHTEALAKQFSIEQVHKNPELYNCGGDTHNFRYPYCYGDFTYSDKVTGYLMGIVETVPVFSQLKDKVEGF